MSKKSQQKYAGGKPQGKPGAALTPPEMATREQVAKAIDEAQVGVAPKTALTDAGVLPNATALDDLANAVSRANELGIDGDGNPLGGGDGLGVAGVGDDETEPYNASDDMTTLTEMILDPEEQPATRTAAHHKAAHHPAKAKSVSTGNDLLALAASYQPSEAKALSQPTQIGNGVFAQVQGDILTIAIPVTKRMRQAARPSGEKGDGALCLMAQTGGFKLLGLDDLKINVMLGFPNPNKAVQSKQRVRER